MDTYSFFFDRPYYEKISQEMYQGAGEGDDVKCRSPRVTISSESGYRAGRIFLK